MAYENSYAIRQATEELEAAKGKSVEMLINFFPKVRLQAASVWVDDDVQLVDYEGILGRFAPLVPDFIRQKTILDISHSRMVGAAALQPIFMGGKILTANRMAQEAVVLREELVKVAQRNSIEEAEDAYWLAVELQNKAKLAEAYHTMLQEALRNVEILLQEGVVTQSDLLDIKVKLSEANLKLSQAQEGLALSRMLLAVRCGMSASSPLAPAEDLEISLQKAPHISLLSEQNVAEITALLPEMQALRYSQDIAKLRINLERSAYLPKVALVGAVGYSNPQFWAQSRGKKWGSNSFIGISVSLGVTDAVSAVYKTRQSKAQWLKQKWDTEEKEQMLKLKVQQAWLKYNESDKQITLATTQKEQAQESLRMATLAYKEGLIPLLQLTQAQTLWLQVETSFIEAQISKCKAVYALYRLNNPQWYEVFASHK